MPNTGRVPCHDEPGCCGPRIRRVLRLRGHRLALAASGDHGCVAAGRHRRAGAAADRGGAATRERTVLRTSDLHYDLPERFIATHPVHPRDAAKLMVVDRSGGGPARHMHVRDLPSVLRAGDLLVVNATRVIPARVLGRRADTGGRVEGLWLADAPGQGAGTMGGDAASLRWRVMLRGKRLRPG
ncbi:MAG: S-adenosylmethionine:tRNA ribosyltransferase-isomerase, partial [Phycisphaerae bacterium]|nr:S-adenosylmethionine:tRNA ribosyltransferase-isomerase [Phycisphaerae bacterium]